MQAIRFDALNHKYYGEDGKEIISVTKIIGLLDKPALIGWAAKITAEYFGDLLLLIAKGKLKIVESEVPMLFQKGKGVIREKKKAAADKGTIIHTLVENYDLRGESPTDFPDEQIQNSFNAYLKFRKEHKMGEVLHSELAIGSKYGYCGKIDRVEMFDGKLYLNDIKSSAGFYEPSMPLQLAAYRQGFKETTGKDVKGIGIIRLDKETGEPFWKDYSEHYEIYLRMFLSLLDYYTCSQELPKKSKW